MARRQIISLLVNDDPGVLLRVSSLFTRKGFNIKSIAAGQTHSREITRMTIVIEDNDADAEQLIAQVSKIQDVVKATLIPEDQSVECELMLIKVLATPPERPIIHKIAFAYHADVVDIGQHSMTLQVVGKSQDLDLLTDHLREQGVLELVRTGLSALQAGDTVLDIRLCKNGLEIPDWDKV